MNDLKSEMWVHRVVIFMALLSVVFLGLAMGRQRERIERLERAIEHTK
jgi:hypothetical protein